MCRECVKQILPSRGNVCIESGSYLLNFKGCVVCGAKEALNITDHNKQEDDNGEEQITYKHVCSSCDHVIAEHEYTFQVEGDYQEYMMTCLLCGSAEDTVCIYPDDPRKANQIF